MSIRQEKNFFILSLYIHCLKKNNIVKYIISIKLLSLLFQIILFLIFIDKFIKINEVNAQCPPTTGGTVVASCEPAPWGCRNSSTVYQTANCVLSDDFNPPSCIADFTEKDCYSASCNVTCTSCPNRISSTFCGYAGPTPAGGGNCEDNSSQCSNYGGCGPGRSCRVRNCSGVQCCKCACDGSSADIKGGDPLSDGPITVESDIPFRIS